MQFINVYKIYLILAVLIAFGLQLVNVNGYILDSYGFRQAQTAITAFWFLEDGVTFPYLTPVFGWPWSAPFEFPTYQILVYLCVKIFNITNLDLAGRIVSLLFYYLSLHAIYIILKKLNINSKSIIVIFIPIVLSPIYIFWSRTFMIESTALYFALMSIYFVLSLSESTEEKKSYYVLLLLFGIIAALTKITTFLVALIFVTFYFIFMNPRKILTKKTIFIALGIISAIIIGFLWTKYGDSIKNLNAIASYITSKNLSTWNFGTIQARMEITSYLQIFKHIFINNGYSLILLIFAPTLLFCNIKDKKLMLISLLTFLFSFMVLFNLFFVHTYYWYSNNLFLSIAIGLLLAAYFNNIKNIYLLHISFLAIILISCMSYYKNYYEIQSFNYHNSTIIKVSDVIKDKTNKNDIVYIKGLDWSSELPYYSKRKAIMVTGWDNIDIENPQFEKILDSSLKENSKLGALVLCGLKPEEIDKRLKYFNFKNTPDYGDEQCLLFTQKGYDQNQPIQPIEEMSKNVQAPWEPKAMYYRGQLILWAHIPSKAKLKISESDKLVKFGYGVKEEAYTGEDAIKGACFKIANSSNMETIWEKCINPKSNVSDQGIIHDEIIVPKDTKELVFETLPNQTGDGSWGHTYWTDIQIDENINLNR